MRKIFFRTLFLTITLLPLTSWLLWRYQPERRIEAIILDKTVLTPIAQEHHSFNWVLKYNRYLKKDGTFYDPHTDYFGFFPLKEEKYRIRDFSSYTSGQLDSIAKRSDLLYYTDTYGMYYNEWYLKVNQTEHSKKIYGGLDQNDVYLLKQIIQQNKLAITEFNLFNNPTPYSIRKEAEDLLHVKWSGWTCRYFHSLDTLINKELPKWVVRLYKQQHQNQWNFKKSGIVFVHEDSRIAILENKNELIQEIPEINTTEYGQKEYQLPEKINYPFWLEITLPADSTNTIVSNFRIHSNSTGDSILAYYGIPKIFPAIQENLKNSKYYYFSGDFCDNTVEQWTNHFKGIHLINILLSDKIDHSNRKNFFWKYYKPLIDNILKKNIPKD